VGWLEIEILTGPRREPILRLQRRPARLAPSLAWSWTISLSHTHEAAPWRWRWGHSASPDEADE
jgi:phosphopantetheinyl transferase (holo-ACP synthase)